MARKWFRRIASAIAAVTVALSTTLVLAQTPAAQKEMAEHQQKMAEQKAMMAKMAAADQKLAGLVATMNAAKGEGKVVAMAAVINELVAQRTHMQEQMRMQGGMMERMMTHMSAMHGSGGATTDKAPAKPKDATEADHGAHHPEK